MTKCEILTRIFDDEADREAEHCLLFILSALQPLDGKFFDTLEAATLAHEKLQYGCAYWNVREFLICGVKIGALEFLNGRFKLKYIVKPCDNLEEWRNSIERFFSLKDKIRVLEILMAGRSPEYIAQQERQAADKLAQNFLPLPNKTSVLLVNRAHPLPNDYAAENLIELAKVPRHFLLESSDMRLSKEAYFAAEEMFTAAAADGLEGFLILSAYRNQDAQARQFANGYAGYVALPGTSEHETGLAMDISAETGDNTFFNHTPHYDWLTNHAHEFGFIRRYPKFKEKFTGVFYEPHHYRYVGKEVAQALHDGGLSLEEYCAGEIDQPARQQSIHGTITIDGSKLNRYNTLFADIAELDNPEYFDAPPKFELLIDGRRYKAEIFACVGYWSGDMRTERTDFYDDEDFAYWLKNIRARSRIKFNVAVTAQDSVVTFSTCAYPIEGDFNRYAAYAVLRELRGSNMQTNKFANTADGHQWHITEQEGLSAGLTLQNSDGTPGTWGHMYNIGIYHFHGKAVTLVQARALLKFAVKNHRCAENLSEAMA